MPLNCPLQIEGDCFTCRYLTDDKCWWFFPGLKLSEILTAEERITRVEQIKQSEQPKWTGKQYDIIRQLQGMVRYLESKVMEQRASKKKDDGF